VDEIGCWERNLVVVNPCRILRSRILPSKASTMMASAVGGGHGKAPAVAVGLVPQSGGGSKGIITQGSTITTVSAIGHGTTAPAVGSRGNIIQGGNHSIRTRDRHEKDINRIHKLSCAAESTMMKAASTSVDPGSGTSRVP
jgi:hypothetical protein